MTPNLDWPTQWAKISPNAIALVDGETGEELSYAELEKQSRLMALTLRNEYHIRKGDRVACMAPNELSYITLFFALVKLGAILVPINTRFTDSEVEHILNDCTPKLFIKNFSEIKLQDHGDFNFESDRNFEDTILILYTSGTTGFPKGAMISHRMIFWNSINTGLRLNLTQADCVVTFLPLFHTGGWNVLTTPCLHRGAKVILLKKFDAEKVLHVCEKYRVTVLFGVPTTMDFLKRHPDFAQSNLSSIRYAVVGGEPMPLELTEAWEKRSIPIRQGYGLTEFGPNVFSLNEEDSKRKVGSIGFPNFYVTAKIVDPDGFEVPRGEVGELILKGPVSMSGYWNNSSATAQTIREGWLYTGDLVRQDGEGYFYVVGRKKEMFISGGENVYPAEVEKVIRAYPGVREVAVIGIPHNRWGECGRAFLALDQDIEPSSIKEYCLKHLAKFKVPQDFVILSELPKTQSGKIAKLELRSISL